MGNAAVISNRLIHQPYSVRAFKLFINDAHVIDRRRLVNHFGDDAAGEGAAGGNGLLLYRRQGGSSL